MPWDPIIYKLQYTLLTLLASLFWLIDRAVLFVTLMVYSVKSFIINTTSGDGGFVMETLNNMITASDGLQTLVILVAGLALLVFFLSRIMRPILETNPVDPGRVLLWLALFGMLLTLGSSFFLDLERGRDGLRQLASGAVIGANSNSFTPAGIPGNLPNQMRAPRHFPFNGPSGCAVPPCADGDASNGLDLALAFLFVSAEDEVSTMSGGDPQHQYMPLLFTQRAAEHNPSDPPQNPSPEDGYGGYFYWDTAHTDLANNDQRQAAVDRAVQGVVRMMAAIPVCLFALLEALIYLAFTIAAAVLFISVPLAMIFAFFKSTEVVMVGLVRSYIALYAKTFAVTALLTLFFSFLLWFATAGNWGAFMAIAIVMLIFSFQFLGLAFGTVRGSLDTLTSSLNSALGTPASTRQGLREARSLATSGLAAAGQGASLAATGGRLAGRLAGGALGGQLGLAAGAAGMLAGRQTAARLSGLVGGLRDHATPSGSSSARVVNGGGAGRNQGTASGERRGALARIAAPDGAMVRSGRVGARLHRAVEQALQLGGDREAIARLLARTDLALENQSSMAGLIETRPQAVRAVSSALDETLDEQPQLEYLRDGRLDPGSHGMAAVLDKLSSRLPAEEIARLQGDAAGQSELRLLVGARLGLERKFGRSELTRGIAGAARAGGGVESLTAGLGVAPHAFGAHHAAVDHFTRELHTLGLTGEDDVRSVLILARDVRRGSPSSDFGAASRARAVQGRLPALGHFERKLRLAASRSTLADGSSDPRVAELRIQRLLRDALEVPNALYAQVVPDLAAAAPMPDAAPTTAMPPLSETLPLDTAAAPGDSGDGNGTPVQQRETDRFASGITTGTAAPSAANNSTPAASDGAEFSTPLPLTDPDLVAAVQANGQRRAAVSGTPRGGRRPGRRARGRSPQQTAQTPAPGFPLHPAAGEGESDTLAREWPNLPASGDDQRSEEPADLVTDIPDAQKEQKQ